MNRKVKMQIIGKGKYGLEINGKLKKRKRKCLEITKRRKSMGYRREKLKKCKGRKFNESKGKVRIGNEIKGHGKRDKT